ncbi:FAD-binding domain-containing protein [Jaminaea rosea]|uniref:FAD-binding domain-containing protein n=1 Tax=Jaminaea rosea TaxID=1569628 RepID=A0A316URH9_9BASI|nr:FAD-binding domain-containing protein [Jaminaea rosea]PWN26921.1 FAD-binding domain-containing protein [Jaminaea rosea]
MRYPLATLFAALISASLAHAATPGQTACSQIQGSLGQGKVANPNLLNFQYQQSKNGYWNTRLNANNPACAVYPSSASDVSTSLKAIKAAGSRFAIKAGGHNPNANFSSTNNGVLLDMSKMTDKSYDPAKGTCTYQPGNKFGDLYEFYEQFGVTITGARLSGVGSGLGLGGGLSYLSGEYGLSVDGFQSLEVVLPSGEIVTASKTSYPDLFFAMRGGGGNAYGVVTSYTVTARKVGKFHSGLLVYALNETNRVLEAVHDFTRYNTNPKANLIATWEKIPLPDLNINLDEIFILFAVYDGEDPGNSYKNFTDIPHILDTRQVRSYVSTTRDLATPFATDISKGSNTFRVSVHAIDDDTYKQAYDQWRAWAQRPEIKSKYMLTSLDFQPVLRSLTDASKSQGGNAMDMPDGPWFWLNYLLTTPPTLSASDYNEIQESFKEMVNVVPAAKNLPLFINDAAYDQNPLPTFSTYQRLKSIKAKYDPDGFFSSKTGGWAFP